MQITNVVLDIVGLSSAVNTIDSTQSTGICTTIFGNALDQAQTENMPTDTNNDINCNISKNIVINNNDSAIQVKNSLEIQGTIILNEETEKNILTNLLDSSQGIVSIDENNLTNTNIDISTTIQPTNNDLYSTLNNDLISCINTIASELEKIFSDTSQSIGQILDNVDAMLDQVVNEAFDQLSFEDLMKVILITKSIKDTIRKEMHNIALEIYKNIEKNLKKSKKLKKMQKQMIQILS